jgi:hypothetical protein
MSYSFSIDGLSAINRLSKGVAIAWSLCFRPTRGLEAKLLQPNNLPDFRGRSEVLTLAHSPVLWA